MAAVSSPLVSVVLAVHDDAPYLPLAAESVLRQRFADLELIVVDDASTDETPSLLDAIRDPRLVVLTNDEQLGLAASLNRALDRAHGTYVARLDADDVAMPDRLELQLARIRAAPRVAAVGTGILDLDAEGRPGRLHRLPVGTTAVRWHALFSAPMMHPTTLVERASLDDHGIRYDASYLESEDYDLFTRLLSIADADNLAEPLVLKRIHARQASIRRRDLQESFQRQIALREISRLAPELADAELAWRLGTGRSVPAESLDRAATAYLSLLERFEEAHSFDRAVWEAVARTLARNGLVRRALRLVPSLPARTGAARARRAKDARVAQRRATAWLERLARPSSLRVTIVSPEPTPYRAPLLDRVAEQAELELTVVYAATTVAGRTWSGADRDDAVVLRGVRIPGARRILRHDYPVTAGIFRALRVAQPDVVVVSGWSTFAAQAAIAWCRTRHVPFVLLVESHDLDRRGSWRRLVKGSVVPPIVRGAAGVLVVGSAARDSVISHGARPERVRVFANTVDVPLWEERAERLRERRRDLRAALGAGDTDVVVLSAARLAREKGLETLVRGVATAGDRALSLVIAGSGPREHDLTALAGELGVRFRLLGELPEERLAEAYVAADVFALLSLHEPWGVVVNEAAASGLPLVLSNYVGAARDLLREGENGFVVPAGDVGATAEALRRLAHDRELRARARAVSTGLVREWGYEPSVASFVAAVREAASR